MVKKRVKGPVKIIALEIPCDSDLPLRLRRISRQTGLSPVNLLQKWMLQEESAIGLARYNRETSPEPEAEERGDGRQEGMEISVVQEPAESESTATAPGTDAHRKMLLRKAKKLKKEGLSLKKIAEAFNTNKMTTISGSGKWYASSVNNLLRSKL